MEDNAASRPALLAKQHILFASRHAKFLPTAYQQEDSNRMTLAYFCLASLALLPSSAVSSANPELSALEVMLKDSQREGFRNWVYEQQLPSGGFRGSESLGGGNGQSTAKSGATEAAAGPASSPTAPSSSSSTGTFTSLDTPHIIQSYTALLNLALLNDDFLRLNRRGLLDFLGACQNEDGSFSHFPGCSEDPDPRSTYSAFAIASMLNDWSTVNIDRALDFLNSCRRYEGGFAQRPGAEANAGPTYCAVASFSLASRLSSIPQPEKLLRWLVDRQVRPPPPAPSSEGSDDEEEEEDEKGAEEEAEKAGFQGRANKPTDACYSFWSTAALELLLPALPSNPPLTLPDVLDPALDRAWLLGCQHPLYGGIAREPRAPPDVYHTYLSLAALSLGNHTLPPSASSASSASEPPLSLARLDAGWNVPVPVAQRIRDRLSKKKDT
ncbi:hypothetical protein JCM8097_000603 [Rhodosporidiobolus ruineniae]